MKNEKLKMKKEGKNIEYRMLNVEVKYREMRNEELRMRNEKVKYRKY